MVPLPWLYQFEQRHSVKGQWWSQWARGISEHQTHWRRSSSKAILILSLPVIFIILGHLINIPFAKCLLCPCLLYWEPPCEHEVLVLRGLVFSTPQQSILISGKTRLLSPSPNLTGSFSTLSGLSATPGTPAPSHLSKIYLFFKAHTIIFSSEASNHARFGLSLGTLQFFGQYYLYTDLCITYPPKEIIN